MPAGPFANFIATAGTANDQVINLGNDEVHRTDYAHKSHS